MEFLHFLQGEILQTCCLRPRIEVNESESVVFRVPRARRVKKHSVSPKTGLTTSPPPRYPRRGWLLPSRTAATSAYHYRLLQLITRPTDLYNLKVLSSGGAHFASVDYQGDSDDLFSRIDLWYLWATYHCHILQLITKLTELLIMSHSCFYLQYAALAWLK